MFYLVFFLTVFALFSAFFFICAVYSAAKLDSLFSQVKPSSVPHQCAFLKWDGKEESVLIETLSPLENGDTLVTLRLLNKP